MPESREKLVRAIGRWSLAALMLNIIIGSGIFGVPANLATAVGRSSPLLFLIAAVAFAVFGGCFAEVASRFREAGGPYLYANTAFGRFFGLQTGWFTWLTRLTASAANANLLVTYLGEFWPEVTAPWPRAMVLTLMIGGLAWINLCGVKFGTVVSNGFTLAKVAALTAFVAGGLIFLSHHPPAPALAHPAPAEAWLEALLLVVFAYVGFEAALIPAGEVRDPGKDVPIALLCSIGAAAVLFTLIQVVFVYTVPAGVPVDRPLATAARIFGGPIAATAISLGAVISVFGYLAAGLIVGPRVTYALAEHGDFPRWFGRVHHRYRTPHTSILVFAVLLWLLSIFGNFRWNATLSAVSRLFTYGVVCAALPVLRRKLPNTGTFRLPAGPLLAWLGIAFAVVIASRMGRGELIALAITTAFAFVNWLLVRGRARPAE
jgi:APA family basic amino acid/polyamine antiporter